jgi:hypothetical protein
MSAYLRHRREVARRLADVCLCKGIEPSELQMLLLEFMPPDEPAPHAAYAGSSGGCIDIASLGGGGLVNWPPSRLRRRGQEREGIGGEREGRARVRSGGETSGAGEGERGLGLWHIGALGAPVCEDERAVFYNSVLGQRSLSQMASRPHAFDPCTLLEELEEPQDSSRPSLQQLQQLQEPQDSFRPSSPGRAVKGEVRAGPKEKEEEEEEAAGGAANKVQQAGDDAERGLQSSNRARARDQQEVLQTPVAMGSDDCRGVCACRVVGGGKGHVDSNGVVSDGAGVLPSSQGSHTCMDSITGSSKSSDHVQSQESLLAHARWPQGSAASASSATPWAPVDSRNPRGVVCRSGQKIARGRVVSGGEADAAWRMLGEECECGCFKEEMCAVRGRAASPTAVARSVQGGAQLSRDPVPDLDECYIPDSEDEQVCVEVFGGLQDRQEVAVAGESGVLTMVGPGQGLEQQVKTDAIKIEHQNASVDDRGRLSQLLLLMSDSEDEGFERSEPRNPNPETAAAGSFSTARCGGVSGVAGEFVDADLATKSAGYACEAEVQGSGKACDEDVSMHARAGPLAGSDEQVTALERGLQSTMSSIGTLPLVQAKLRVLSPRSRAPVKKALEEAVSAAVETFAASRSQILARAEEEIAAVRARVQREVEAEDVRQAARLHAAVVEALVGVTKE